MHLLDANYAQKLIIWKGISLDSQPQWPRGLRLGSAVARWLELRFRIPPEAYMFVRCMHYVFSGRSHSSRGDLPSVVCLSMIVKPR
jgi:hypothetical protein